jgi:hypothetical protein
MIPSERIKPLYRQVIEKAASDLQVPVSTRTQKQVIEEQKIKPLIETIDVFISTAAGDVTLPLKQPFVKVSRLIVFQAWDGTTLNYNQFNGGSAGGDTLPFGIFVHVDDKPILPGPIQAQKDYMKYSFDTDVVIDTLGVTKQVYFTSRLSFHKFMGNNEGIDLTRFKMSVFIPAGQDITAFGNEALWTFQGWGWDV